MPVDSLHASYNTMHAPVSMIRDVIAGQAIVKAKGRNYLPYPHDLKGLVVDGKAALAEAFYQAYLERAELEKLAAEAYIRMGGIVSNAPCAVQLPPRMEYLIDKATGDGLSLHNFYTQAVRETLATGRYGVLVDPNDKGQVQLYGYQSESITNWLLDDDVLSAVVLKESYLSGGDKFSPEYSEQYRVFELSGGACTATLYRDDAQVEATTPATSKQSTLDFIPLQLVRAVTNGWQSDNPIPMQAIAEHLIKAYQLSADYYRYLYLLSQVMLTTSGANMETKSPAPTRNNQENKPARTFSSTQALHLASGATANLLQASPAGIEPIKTALNDKIEAARQLAMQLHPNNGTVAAATVKMQIDSQQLTLRGVANNAAQAIEKSLKTAALIMGENADEVVFRAPESLVEPVLDVTEISLLNDMVLNGNAPKSLLWERMRQAKLTNLNDEELQKAIDNQTINGI